MDAVLTQLARNLGTLEGRAIVTYSRSRGSATDPTYVAMRAAGKVTETAVAAYCASEMERQAFYAVVSETRDGVIAEELR